MKTSSFRGILVTCLCFFCGLAEAQENFTVYNEPEFSVEIGTETPWSYSFGIAHRRTVYAQEEYLFVAKNIEVSHMTSYKIKDFGELGLGFKYKFYELFDESSHDELRIMQQYSRSGELLGLKTGHRFRLEERFEDQTSFRTRYKFSVEIPLSRKETVNGFALNVATEALLSMAKEAVPEIDQRFEIGIEKEFEGNWAFEIGFEYQFENYNHDPEVDLFLLTGVSVVL